jgi:hypothetical protein
MSLPRVAVGIPTLLGVGWAVAGIWVYESTVFADVPEGEWSRVQTLLVPAVGATARVLPIIVTVWMLALLTLFLVWAVRTPRLAVASESEAALAQLSEWLKWSWAIAAVGCVCLVAASAYQVRGRFLFLLLVLPFGASYAVCMFRALQLQCYRHERSGTRIAPSLVALGSIAPIVVGLWPLGLLAFTGVFLVARKETR